MGQYGLLLQSIGFLIIIVILAYLAIRYGLRSLYRGINGGRMKVLERAPLDPRSGSALNLVQIGDKVYLIGSAQGGVSLLTTYTTAEIGQLEDEIALNHFDYRTSFAKALERFRKEHSPEDDKSKGGSL